MRGRRLAVLARVAIKLAAETREYQLARALMGDDWRFSHTISTLAARVSLEYDVLIGPRVIGQERWERMKQHRFGLYQNILTEGIPLTPTYGSAPSSGGS